MSLRTRINGFTAWVNLRLGPYDTLLNNVLMDLTKGCHVQQLLHSLTGKNLKKLQSFEGLTQAQKATRIEWMVTELKKSEVLPDEVKIDYRLIAMKAAEHWTPEPPPKKKKKKVTRTSDSMMSGFGSSAQVVEDIPSSSPDLGYDKYPGADDMKSVKPHLPRGGWYSYPSPDECIIDMINSQLQRVSEGHKFTVFSLDDLVDSRALCGLVNSFIPGTFTTEVMLNDRWTINLALSVIGKMLRASNPMGSADLSEADPKSLCAYLCFFFMSSYKLRQSKAVVKRLGVDVFLDYTERLLESSHSLVSSSKDTQISSSNGKARPKKELTLLVQEVDAELMQFPAQLNSRQELKAKKELESTLENYQREQATLQDTYDVGFIDEWTNHIAAVQKETRQIIADKMKERFDLVKLPRSMSINDLCMSVAINLQLTQGAGFYRAYDKERETCTPDRRIVLRDKKSNQFLDDFTGAEGSSNIRDILNLPRHELVVVEPSHYPQYEIYVESTSRNKTLKAGTIFLYQVFPGNTTKWQRLLFKAIRDGDYDVVKKMVVFFRVSHPNFIFSKEANSGNTVLHVAAKYGHFDICKFLLESGCDVNSKNATGCTPLFYAAEGLHKKVGQMLIEWGCRTGVQNFRCQTAFDVMRHDEMKASLRELGHLWSITVPEVTRGRLEPLRRIVKDHLLGIRTMADVSARCIKGSTLLHTAVHFADVPVIKDLLKIRVDVNLKDYQGATPLHRAKGMEILELILDSNGEINAEDNEGNTVLHVRAYGEEDQPSFLDGIKLLMSRGANILHRNARSLLPVHCAAMQGRKDVIELMLQDNNDVIQAEIAKEPETSPPSLPYLAIAANYLGCAEWLVSAGLPFKAQEADHLMYKLLCQELIPDDRADVAKFLLDNGGSVKIKYEGGDSCVHLATRMTGSTDVLQVLVDAGAPVDGVNDEGCSPLFDAMKTNNFHGASILIERGADIRRKNISGITSLDLIHDYDEWIACSLFTSDVVARFKAYKLKHARDLVRAITKKLKQEAQKTKSFLHQTGDVHKPSLALSSQYPPPGILPKKNFLSSSYPALLDTRRVPSPGQSIALGRRLALPPVAVPQSFNRGSQLL